MALLDQAIQLLRHELASGEVDARGLKLKAAEVGIGKQTLNAAAVRLGVARLGRGQKWVWSLPSKPPTPVAPGAPGSNAARRHAARQEQLAEVERQIADGQLKVRQATKTDLARLDAARARRDRGRA